MGAGASVPAPTKLNELREAERAAFAALAKARDELHAEMEVLSRQRATSWYRKRCSLGAGDSVSGWSSPRVKNMCGQRGLDNRYACSSGTGTWVRAARDENYVWTF